MSETSTGYSNVHLTPHARNRMRKYGYCMADIDRMIEQNDERLHMVVVTVLPRDQGNTAEEGRLASAQAKLERAQGALAMCTKPRALRKWQNTVRERQRIVQNLEQRGGSAAQLAQAAMRADAGELLQHSRLDRASRSAHSCI